MADIIGYAGQIIEVIKAVHDVYLRIKGVAKEIDEAMDDCGIMKTDVMDLKKLFSKHTPSKFPDQVKIITQEFKSLNKSMKKLKKLFREYEKISQTLFGKTVWAYNKPRESILEIRSNFASYRTLFAKAMQIINEGHNQDMDRQMKEMRELAKKRDEERKREHAETKRKLKAMDEGRKKDAERFEALIKELISKNQATPENRAGVMEGWLVSEKGMNKEEAKSCASTALREGRVPSIKIEKEEPKKVKKEVKKGGDVAVGKDSKPNSQEAKAKPKPSTTPTKDKPPSPPPLKKDNEKEKQKPIPNDTKTDPKRLSMALGIFAPPLNADIVASTNTAGKTIKLLKSRDATTDLQFSSERSRLAKIEKAVAEHGYQVLSIVNDSGKPCLELKGTWKDGKTNVNDKGLKEPALPKLTPVSAEKGNVKDAMKKTPYHTDNGKVVEVAKKQHQESKKPEHEQKSKSPSPSPAPLAKNKPQSPPPKGDNKSPPNVAPKAQKPKVPVILIQEPRNTNAKSTPAPSRDTPKNNNIPAPTSKNNNTSNNKNTHTRPPSPTPSTVSHVATNGHVKRASSVSSGKSAASQKERIENGMRHVKEGEKRGRSLDPPHSSAHSSSQLNLGLGAQGRSKSQVAYTNGQEGRRRGSEESEGVLYERRLALGS